MGIIPQRRCNKCGESFPRTSEYWHKDKGAKDGLVNICKECARKKTRNWIDDNYDYSLEQKRDYYATHKQERREYIEANREVIAERKRRWRENNPDKVAEHKKRDAEKHKDRIQAYHKAWHRARKEAGNLKPLTEAQKEAARQRARQWYAENKEHASERGKRVYIENQHYIKERVKAWRKANPEKVKILAKVRDSNRRARLAAAEGTFTAAEIRAQFDYQQATCAYCGTSLARGYHVEHVEPIARGGRNDMSNILLACSPCNLSKGAKTLEEWTNRPY